MIVISLPYQPIAPNTLWVVEAIPGRVEARDESETLQKDGFWGSANRPAFIETRHDSGYDSAEKSHGNLYSSTQNPRMLILAAEKPETLGGMRDLMTRNTWTRASSVSPGHAVAARFDLFALDRTPAGAIDAKVVDRCLVKTLGVQAVSSPSHSSLPPFEWQIDGKDLFPGFPHTGLPNKWNFGWVQMSMQGISPALQDATFCG